MISATTLNDIVSFTYLNPEYNKIIANLIYKSYFKYEDLEDIRQELYLNIMTGPQNLVDAYNRGEFKYWFIKMAQNNICSKQGKIYRKFLTKKQLTDELDESINFEFYDDLDKKIDDKNMFKEVQNIVGNLNSKSSKRNFKIFELYFLDGLTGQEISDFTHIPISNVYRYVNEIKKQITDGLDEEIFNEFKKNIKYDNN